MYYFLNFFYWFSFYCQQKKSPGFVFGFQETRYLLCTSGIEIKNGTEKQNKADVNGSGWNCQNYVIYISLKHGFILILVQQCYKALLCDGCLDIIS